MRHPGEFDMPDTIARRVLVTAAGGNQGRIVIPALSAAGFSVRALRSSPGREAELLALGASEVVTGSTADRKTLSRALEGVDCVYHVGPTAHPLEREMGFAMADAVHEKGGVHLIYSSVLHPVSSKIVQHKIKRDVEEYIHESDIESTILQPADYMMPGMFDRAFEEGLLPVPFYMKRPQAMVDLYDVADVVAKIALERNKHFGATYELCGAGIYDGDGIIECASHVSNKKIKSIDTTPEQYYKAAFGHDLFDRNPHAYSVLLSVDIWYRQYKFVGNSNVLGWLLQRPPASLADFCARELVRWKSEAKVP
jgi:uncharacterized protein YbjT (DUF2867 family)